MATTRIEDAVKEEMDEFCEQLGYSRKYVATRGAELFMEKCRSANREITVSCPECGSDSVSPGDILFTAVCEDCGYEDSFGAFEHERQDTEGEDSE